MKLRLLASALFLSAAGLMFADSKPAMVVQVIRTDDADGYVASITQANAIIKNVTGVDKLRHVWTGDYAGDNSHGIFVVSEYPSAASISALGAKMQASPEMKAWLADMKGKRKLGQAYLYKAVRYEGGYDGGAVFNTSIKVSDEAGYLKALDSLKAILDGAGFKDAKVNLWRIAAGRSEATHLVVIALPSQSRLGELLDALTDQNLLAEWNVGAAKLRVSLHNGTYHELTK